MQEALPTVVIVDDAPDVRALVRTRLRLSQRFDVVGEGGDGAAAVALAAEHRPQLMLLDVSMPGMDGLEALPRVRSASPQTRVVMYSGFDGQGLADRAKSLGAVAFVEKATPIGELVDTLQAVLADSAPAPAAPLVPDGSQPYDQQLLDEHAERFRQIFEQAAIGLATMTLTGHVVRANAELARLLKRPLGDLVGIAYADLLSADDAQRLGEALQDLVQGGGPLAELEHGLADVGQVRVILAPVRDARGRPLYLFAQIQDVTAQRAAERQLRLSEQRFRLLVEAVQDYAIFMLDPQGHIVNWNAGAQRSKGYTAEEIVGQHFRVFYPGDKQAERHPEHELEWALRDGSYEEEGWRIRKDGSRFWANVVITAVRDEHGAHVGFAKVTRDTTERRLMLEERERVNEQLAAAAEMQAEFLAVTAHELRTPIGVLSGSADLLAHHWTDMTEGERSETLDAIGDNGRRLRRLLADLLTVARLDAEAVQLHPAPVDVGTLLETAATAARRTAPSARIDVELAQPLTVFADADRLAQAIDNLVGNALRHGGEPVRLTADAHGDFVQIRVVDSGSGVPRELADRLFERFATGADEGGTGLGLFIVRELARAHGGDADYEPPTPDNPSGAFVLRVPRVDNSPQP